MLFARAKSVFLSHLDLLGKKEKERKRRNVPQVGEEFENYAKLCSITTVCRKKITVNCCFFVKLGV